MNWTQEELERRNREVLGVGTPFYTAQSGWTNEGLAEQERRAQADVALPEWMIEAECTKLLEQDGWRALRTDPVSDRGRGKGFGELGMADHLYIRYTPFPRMSPDGHYMSASHTLWIEFKAAKGTPQKNQIEWHTKERARGALTLIAGQDFPASIEGFVAWYRASGLNRGRI